MTDCTSNVRRFATYKIWRSTLFGVKLLYLEENCLESMNGLQPLKQLQCLYLRKNFIKSIDHIEGLQFLDTLDISQNYISCLENLSKSLRLRVLVVSHNQLESIESIAHLTSCPSIMILDLSHNELKDGDGVLKIALSLPKLAVLYLSGNPCISRMPHYRKVNKKPTRH
ncbi:hypothetical protein Mapa_013609 [Marchantia paleacea]|nr:hypothetical protein Mapa_013609 [Marchantia paleacea]